MHIHTYKLLIEHALINSKYIKNYEIITITATT